MIILFICFNQIFVFMNSSVFSPLSYSIKKRKKVNRSSRRREGRLWDTQKEKLYIFLINPEPTGLRLTLVLLVKELKATNETLKSLQTQLELAYASTASSGAPVAGGLSSGTGSMNTGTILGGSVAVPGGVPGSTTLTAILETKDARIQTLEKEIGLLEAELQRIRECGGKLREQLLRATAVPSGINSNHNNQANHHSGINLQGSNIVNSSTTCPSPFSNMNAFNQSTLVKGSQYNQMSLVPSTNQSTFNNSLLAGSTGLSSCLAGISAGVTTGVSNPYTERYAADNKISSHINNSHQHQHHHQHQHQHQHHQHVNKQIESSAAAAAGALALHAHTFNKHDMNFKRQVSFFINNVRIEKNDVV